MSMLSRALAVLPAFQNPPGFGSESKVRQSLTLISSGCEISGALVTPGSLRVEGCLSEDGRVQGSVEVVKGAAILGVELHCQDLLVAGVVEANVYVEGAVRIVSGGFSRAACPAARSRWRSVRSSPVR